MQLKMGLDGKAECYRISDANPCQRDIFHPFWLVSQDLLMMRIHEKPARRHLLIFWPNAHAKKAVGSKNR